MSDDTPAGPGTAGDEREFRWWFEEEIDPELEAEYDLALRYGPETPVSAPDSQEEQPAEGDSRGEPVHDAGEVADPVGAPDIGTDAAVEEDSDADVAPRSHRRRRVPGRRRLRRLALLVAGLFAVGLIGAVALAIPWDRLGGAQRPQQRATEQQSALPAAAVDQDTLLLVRHGPQDDGPALGVTLLAATADEAAVIFVPEGTIVDIPGFGQDRLGLAYQYGGTALVEATVENLMGIDIDHTAAVSNSGLSALLARTGGLDVEVKEQLVARTAAGAGRVRFEPGAQFLDGERLVEFWGFRQRGESELDTFPRQQLVWVGLLAASSDPQVVQALTSDGAPQLDTSARERFLSRMLTRLAQAQETGQLEYTLLPVTPFGAQDETGTITYKPTPVGVRRLVDGRLAGSVPESGTTQGVRIQVLNGVGTPGVGQEVDERLEGAGFRIVLTDNARSFDFDQTRILVYSDDDRFLAAAEQVQRRLGVGTIQISRQPQSVVDLTIVVGADFLAEIRAERDPVPDPQEQSS